MALPTQDFIFVRSPFIIEVDDATQTGSKVELFIYKSGSPIPATPTYTLSKLIPASNKTVTLYNLSPYIRENITHPTSPDNANVNLQFTPIEEYTLVYVKTYNLIGGTYVAQFNTTYKAFDGYGYYETGINPDYSFNIAVVLADQMNYNYYYDPAYPTTSESLAGTITAYLGSAFTVEYTGLQTGTVFTYLTLFSGLYDLFRVPPSMISEGAKVVISTGPPPFFVIPFWTGYFRPVTECKYEPIVLDFINKYGGWQRETFFKASFENLEVQSTPYNFMMTIDALTYDVKQGQKQIFNNNGSTKIKINSGWVDEKFSENLQQLLLSERVLWTKGDTKLPIRINTKSVNKEKNINNKKINYSLDFEMAFDVINNVI
jgi:hypothetical protein